jgi:FkbM family methyltransferase
MQGDGVQEQDVRKLLRTVAFARAHRSFLGRWIAKHLARHVYRDVLEHPSVRLIVEYDGGLFCVDTGVDSGAQRRILFEPLHEFELVRLIRAVARPGMTCLDVGAGTGAHALVMAHAVGPKGRVVAVEPHPDAARCLRDNVAINRLRNVTVIEGALCRSDGSVQLFSGRDVGVASLVQLEAKAEAREVRGLSGAALLREAALASCDLIKIDVNGFEWVALDELRQLIAREHPHVIFKHKKEHWEEAGFRVADALAMFDELHYQVFCILEGATWALTGAPPAYCKLLCVPDDGAGS